MTRLRKSPPHFATLIVALLLLGFSNSMAQDLSNYRWKNRILSIVTPSLDDTTYQAQSAALIAVFPGLMERDIVVITSIKSTEFEISLIGKDGGEKLIRKSVLATEELFAIIDAMPMRRDEMRSAPSSD